MKFLLIILCLFSNHPASATEANLKAPNVLWTQTSPVQQVVLGIGDVAVLVTLDSLQDPYFRKATNNLRAQLRREMQARDTFIATKSIIDENLWKQQAAETEFYRTVFLQAASNRGVALSYKILRIGGSLMVGIDLGSRIVYYFIAQKDPGWYPFGSVLKMFGRFTEDEKQQMAYKSTQ
jgi:hypothetical protein